MPTQSFSKALLCNPPLHTLYRNTTFIDLMILTAAWLDHPATQVAERENFLPGVRLKLTSVTLIVLRDGRAFLKKWAVREARRKRPGHPESQPGPLEGEVL